MPHPVPLQDSLRRVFVDALADAAGLLFPVDCAGCDAPGRPLCPACHDGLRAAPRTRTADGLVVHSAVRFDGVAARVVRALKEDGRTGLTRPLGALVAETLGRAGWTDALLVPVPTSRAAFRRRGYAVPELLAGASGAPWMRLLRPGVVTGDQRALGRSERAQNVVGAFRVRGEVPGMPLVVLDDVVTTGATLAEAARVLTAAGAEVLGAVTVADTPRRHLR